ncbi:phosphoribosylformylglycinamidine cyclo-ligase [Gleimia europaea]|uniref:Phosphoribosylformylglycinamidine cyclo-ligase n=1 Tax=Gleimia europaea ACS-120-V-Col10b TaxID=883069 RepID=A0A9W5VWQ8_9ACTO|nr:phosphoribosylformylglycinamidine cyclo-ligase [Gleimia europaea]EPD31173.1 phosphoribosylformylglycinamidine cyclo-ligase [Gleimia europaea ACS-120-V-Col10b]
MVDYAAAGVDIEAGDRAVELMKAAVAKSHNATVFGDSGGFAGMIDASALKDMKRPLLASSTDGVGTKIAIAQEMGIHDTIGQDLVAMVVDDLVVMGARPLLMTDYIATGRVDPQKIADIVRGVAQACAQVDCPLIGGETAEHPGLMDPQDYDIAGAATGVVDADEMLGAHRVTVGDVLIGIASSGLHSNGYSLVRKIVADSTWKLDRDVPEFGRTLGEELLEPTRLYTKQMLAMIESLPRGAVKALSHITGGGLGANISRVIPTGFIARVDRSSWAVPPVFSTLSKLGEVSWDAMEQTFNLGVGMVAIVDEAAADEALGYLMAIGCEPWVLGEVELTSSSLQVADSDRLVQGAKGVQAGAALLTGSYRL